MARPGLHVLSTPQERMLEAARQVALVVGASLFVALCCYQTLLIDQMIAISDFKNSYGFERYHD